MATSRNRPVKTAKIDWQERYNQTRRELHEAVGKYVEAEKDKERLCQRWREAADAKPKIIVKEVLPPWCGILTIGTAIFCVGSSLIFYWIAGQLEQPILKPYPVELSRQKAWDTALKWQGRCRQAWEVLKDHHSGHYNGIAWRILNGDEER